MQRKQVNILAAPTGVMCILQFGQYNSNTRDIYARYQQSLSSINDRSSETASSMEQSTYYLIGPPKTPRILLNTRFHYRIHKSPPIFPILSLINSVHTLLPYFFNINFNIIFPLRPKFSKWCPSFRILHQNSTCIYFLYYLHRAFLTNHKLHTNEMHYIFLLFYSSTPTYVRAP